MSAGTDIKTLEQRLGERKYSRFMASHHSVTEHALIDQAAELRAALEAAEQKLAQDSGRNVIGYMTRESVDYLVRWQSERLIADDNCDGWTGIQANKNALDGALIPVYIGRPDSGRDAALESGMYVSVEGSSVEWGPDGENWCMDIPGDAPILDKVATAIRHANQYVADNRPVAAQQGEQK